MKNIGKLLALILALTLAFTCTACGDPESSKSSSKKQKETIPSSTAASVPEESNAQTAPENNNTTPATQPEYTESSQPTEPEHTETTQPTEPEHTETTQPTEPEHTETTQPTEPEHTESPQPTEPTVDLANNYFFNDSNYAYDADNLSVKPRYVYWQEDGTLVAECFVINGFSHTVYNIEVKSLTFANAEGTIAAGSFGTLQNLVLGPYQYVVWTFTFSPDCVSAAYASLSTLLYNASTSNWY